MSESRIFIVKTQSVKCFLKTAINDLEVDKGRPIEVIIRPYKEKRSTQANEYMWSILKDISEQAFFQDIKYSTKVWHEHCKRSFLPEKCAKGIEKWSELPITGEPILNMSTTDLNTKEFADYCTQLEVFAIELGVKLTEHRVYDHKE